MGRGGWKALGNISTQDFSYSRSLKNCRWECHHRTSELKICEKSPFVVFTRHTGFHFLIVVFFAFGIFFLAALHALGNPPFPTLGRIPRANSIVLRCRASNKQNQHSCPNDHPLHVRSLRSL